MTVEEKKNFGKAQKEHLIHMILLYQKEPVHTMESLRGKTLKQLEKICEKEGI